MKKKISSSTKRRRTAAIVGCSSSETSEVIVNHSINVDLLTEILLRLPVAPLLRFKCVSKPWLSLISDSHFTSNYSLRRCSSINPCSGLYFRCNYFGKETTSVSLPGYPQNLPTLTFLDVLKKPGSETKIIHSCNGLMLLHNYSFDANNLYKVRYFVSNFTLQKYTLLPEPRNTFSSSTYTVVLGAYLIFDLSKSPHYKVVVLSSDSKVGPLGHYRDIDIYYSESGSWKHISGTTTRALNLGHGVFWNGSIHWMSDRNFHVTFEVDTEKLIEVPNPPTPKILSQDKIRYFGECGGHLLLIQFRDRSALGFRILEMEDNKDNLSWVVKYRVNLRHLISVFPQINQYTSIGCRFDVMSVVEGSNKNDFVLVMAIAGKVVTYNLNCKTFKVLCDLPPCYFSESSIYKCSFKFVESLIPV